MVYGCAHYRSTNVGLFNRCLDTMNKVVYLLASNILACQPAPKYTFPPFPTGAAPEMQLGTGQMVLLIGMLTYAGDADIGALKS